jgi:hypothetical protein
MAPRAAEGTAFEKHGGPDTGAVKNGKFLYIKDNSPFHYG